MGLGRGVCDGGEFVVGGLASLGARTCLRDRGHVAEEVGSFELVGFGVSALHLCCHCDCWGKRFGSIPSPGLIPGLLFWYDTDSWFVHKLLCHAVFVSSAVSNRFLGCLCLECLSIACAC